MFGDIWFVDYEVGLPWETDTFEFDPGKLKEISAKEVTGEEVKEIASLPEDFDEMECE